jgi:hypothetical protein
VARVLALSLAVLFVLFIGQALNHSHATAPLANRDLSDNEPLCDQQELVRVIHAVSATQRMSRLVRPTSTATRV